MLKRCLNCNEFNVAHGCKCDEPTIELKIHHLTDSELLALKQEYFGAGRKHHGKAGGFVYMDVVDYEQHQGVLDYSDLEKQPVKGGEEG